HFFHLSAVWLYHEIPIDDHSQRKPWPDRQRGLDIHLLPHELLSGPTHGISKPLAQRLNDGSVVVFVRAPAFTSLPTDSNVDGKAADRSTDSSGRRLRPQARHVLEPGCRSSTIERPSAMSRVQTSSTRD